MGKGKSPTFIYGDFLGEKNYDEIYLYNRLSLQNSRDGMQLVPKA